MRKSSERLREGMDPRTLPITHLEIWVQLHGIGTGFMSQRVVVDIGNHIGKFVESDVNNFVGVWRDHFRVRVSIPLDAPLKRRMKLRKSATEWCWVTFKYEAVPMFCFICGLIGHSDKFCAKLFEAQGEEIEKPYGSWMRADPKRRSYTMGNKWLRPGGAIPANKVGEEEGDKSQPVKVAAVSVTHTKSGITGNNRSQGIPLTNSENYGVKGGIQDKSAQAGISHSENNTTVNLENMDNNEIVFTDPKRRRRAQDGKSPMEDVLFSPQEEEVVMEDNTQTMQQNQKNEILAGTASQSRLSL